MKKNHSLRLEPGTTKILRFFPLTAYFMACLTGCSGCDDALIRLPDPGLQEDVFQQKANTLADILWVVDNSESMRDEQRKLAAAFDGFFQELLRSQVDYHIGVVTTDASEGGTLRAFDGNVPGCEACRFLTRDVGCSSVDGTNEQCDARDVFQNLIAAGTEGASFEEGFAQAARALGITLGEQENARDFPPANEGFLREDALLFIVFVSDEDEGDKDAGLPIRYFERLFRGVKGRGEENKIIVSAVVGWPRGDSGFELSELCRALNEPDGADYPAASASLESIEGCVDASVGPDVVAEPSQQAEVGERYLRLACAQKGVVANICDADYSDTLTRLGVEAAGLKRKFVLSAPNDLDLGSDGLLYTDDDCHLDCDQNGSYNDAIDEVLCVSGVPLRGESRVAVPRGENGWQLNPQNGEIFFEGAFVPAPGTEVYVRYQRNVQGAQCPSR